MYYSFRRNTIWTTAFPLFKLPYCSQNFRVCNCINVECFAVVKKIHNVFIIMSIIKFLKGISPHLSDVSITINSIDQVVLFTTLLLDVFLTFFQKTLLSTKKFLASASFCSISSLFEFISTITNSKLKLCTGSLHNFIDMAISRFPIQYPVTS